MKIGNPPRQVGLNEGDFSDQSPPYTNTIASTEAMSKHLTIVLEFDDEAEVPPIWGINQLLGGQVVAFSQCNVIEEERKRLFEQNQPTVLNGYQPAHSAATTAIPPKNP